MIKEGSGSRSGFVSKIDHFGSKSLGPNNFWSGRIRNQCVGAEKIISGSGSGSVSDFSDKSRSGSGSGSSSGISGSGSKSNYFKEHKIKKIYTSFRRV